MRRSCSFVRLAVLGLILASLSGLCLSGCAFILTPTPDVEELARELARVWATQTAEALAAAGESPGGETTGTTVPLAPTEAASRLPDTATLAPTSTPTPEPPTPTPKPTHAWTPKPTLKPKPSKTPTPACPIATDPELAPGWRRSALGCPVGNPAVIWAAWEPFEHGYMLWRSDNDWAYVLDFAGGSDPMQGAWSTLGDASRWDGSFPDGRGLTPPEGRYEPMRGFGFVWFNTLGGPSSQLGWATAPERGICITLQHFDAGFIFKSSTVEFCQDELMNMARDASFAPLLLALQNDGAWRRW